MPTEISGSTGVDKIQSDAIETGDMPTGSVLQVVQAETTTQVTISSSTFADTGLSATITPSSTSNKILVIISQGIFNGGDANLQLKILRGSTVIKTLGYIAGWNSLDYRHASNYPVEYLDSPSTTSAITYKTQGSLYAGNPGHFQYDDGGGDQVSTITLMEIAG